MVVHQGRQEETFKYARSCLIVRNDITAPGESEGYMFFAVLPGPNGVQPAWDTNGDGYIDKGRFNGPISYPCRLRLEKDGTSIRASYSVDEGSTWTYVGGPITLPSASDYQDVGLVVSSLSPYEKSLTEFGEFTVINK